MNREEWLSTLAGKLVSDVLAPAGYTHHAELTEPVEGSDTETRVVPLEERLKVSCSWPSSGGVRSKRRVIGQCWGSSHSTGNVAEIFISPAIDDPVEVAGVLVHELGHAAVGAKQKHNLRFAKFCEAVGLEGKPTATEVGPELREVLEDILKDFPPYPHARLNYQKQTKSQKTRFLKVLCVNEECSGQEIKDGGFKFRLTRIWIDALAVGAGREPGTMNIGMNCPLCGRGLIAELPEDEEED